MGSEFTFYDYIDADGGGANVIRDWLNGEGKPAKAHFTIMIPHLEASPPPGLRDSVWQYPYVKVMKKQWKGFLEIRKTGRVQYRLLAKMEGRSVFLVGHAIHKGQNYKPDVSPETASMRVTQMINNAKYRREHEYS
jgi:hypothetical protein